MESLTGERITPLVILSFLILDFWKLNEICPVPVHILQSFQMSPQPCRVYCQDPTELGHYPHLCILGDPYDDLSSL